MSDFLRLVGYVFLCLLFYTVFAILAIFFTLDCSKHVGFPYYMYSVYILGDGFIGINYLVYMYAYCRIKTRVLVTK